MPCPHFTLKRHQLFFVHTTPEEFLKTTIIAGHFGFVFKEDSVREIICLLWRHRFRKAPFWQCLSSTRKRKVDVFKFLWFEKLHLWRISVDCRTVAVKPRFHISLMQCGRCLEILSNSVVFFSLSCPGAEWHDQRCETVQRSASLWQYACRGHCLYRYSSFLHWSTRNCSQILSVGLQFFSYVKFPWQLLFYVIMSGHVASILAVRAQETQSYCNHECRDTHLTNHNKIAK